jgi:hypothetical protein
MKIRISPGNRKLGGIPSVSLPPVLTCAKGIPCARECYVVRNMLGGPYGAAIGASYRANLDLLRADRDSFFSQLRAYLERRAPRFFRYHVSGDYVDSDHLMRALELARELPRVKFLAFSKRHDLFPKPSVVPKNFSLIASLWPSWGTRPAGYRAAYMQDGTETRRAARKAIECPGNCATCAACWNLPRLGVDVVFHKH